MFILLQTCANKTQKLDAKLDTDFIIGRVNGGGGVQRMITYRDEMYFMSM